MIGKDGCSQDAHEIGVLRDPVIELGLEVVIKIATKMVENIFRLKIEIN
jgi:hypothetical protein